MILHKKTALQKFCVQLLGGSSFYLSKLAVNLWSLGFNKTRRREKRLNLRLLSSGPAIIEAVMQSSPDVIITFRPDDTYAVKCFGKIDIPVVTMSHHSIDIFLHKNTPESVKAAVESSAAVQVLMPEYAQEVQAILPKANVVVIPNIVPQHSDIADRSCKTIINVGRVTGLKQQELIVKAFALIADKYPEWRVKIWGDHDEEPWIAKKLNELIIKHGLSNRVFLCGTTDDIHGELKQSSIFAFPSLSEGFGLALTEAMSMGLPSIGWSGCPAVNSHIHNQKNGFLCDDTPEAFAEALIKLMDDESLL